MSAIEQDYQEYLADAAYYSQRSTHRKHQTGCVIVDNRGKEVSNGWSHMGEWRLSSLYSMHAELHALHRAIDLGKKSRLEGATAFIMTIARKSGNRTNSHPCIVCATALLGAGITKAVVWSPNAKVKHEVLDLDTVLSSLKVYSRPS